MRRGVPAIVARISRDLLLADLDLHRRRLMADVMPDFGEALYAAAVWTGAGRGRRDGADGSSIGSTTPG
jgi:hypothetical protein